MRCPSYVLDVYTNQSSMSRAGLALSFGQVQHRHNTPPLESQIWLTVMCAHVLESFMADTRGNEYKQIQLLLQAVEQADHLMKKGVRVDRG